MDARVLVIDDADDLKTAADENGVYHQVCKNHVLRNTEALIEPLQAGGRRLDGTSNATQRAISWYIKESYRTMRGYKREQFALRVSRLIAQAWDLPENVTRLILESCTVSFLC